MNVWDSRCFFQISGSIFKFCVDEHTEAVVIRHAIHNILLFVQIRFKLPEMSVDLAGLI